MILAQILGLYFIVVGIIVLYRRRAIMPAISRLVSNRPLLLILGLMEILGGIAIALTNPVFTFDADGVISKVSCTSHSRRAKCSVSCVASIHKPGIAQVAFSHS